MYTAEIEIRVRYGETDRMGYVYYGNYAQYFEVARVEAMRVFGITYKDLEDNGILLPVYEFQVTYLKPAYYDDILTIKTTISEIPQARIGFHYQSFNSNGEMVNRAKTTLVFIDKQSGKPIKAPEFFVEKLQAHF
ncbi:MAG: acyl-CoA thioesterase [Flavobacteriales bacterium]|nr:acyl-CoA thioesterase [Flavobacteriales bacterium]